VVPPSTTTTDKYYRAGGPKNAQVLPGRPVPVVGPATPATPTEVTQMFVINGSADVVSVAGQVTQAFQAGQTEVSVRLADADLYNQLASQLDLAVAREDMTREQRQAVRVFSEQQEEESVPTPETEVAADDGLASEVDDMEAFVKGVEPARENDRANAGGSQDDDKIAEAVGQPDVTAGNVDVSPAETASADDFDEVSRTAETPTEELNHGEAPQEARQEDRLGDQEEAAGEEDVDQEEAADEEDVDQEEAADEEEAVEEDLDEEEDVDTDEQS